MNKKVRTLVVAGLISVQQLAPTITAFANSDIDNTLAEVNTENNNNQSDINSDIIKESKGSPVKTEEVNIPDANLKKVLSKALGQDVSLPITQTQLESITSLRERKKDISSLEGIQYCTNLQSLDLSYNKISDISQLSELTNLTSVFLVKNKVTDISPILKLKNLTRGNISSQEITGEKITTSKTTVEVDNTAISPHEFGFNYESSGNYDYDSGTDKIRFRNITNSETRSYSFYTIVELEKGNPPLNFSGSVSHEIEKIDEANDIVNIPDQYLKKALAKTLGQDESLDITKTQLESIITFDARSQKNISSLEGLQYCTNLRRIELGRGSVSDLTPLLGLSDLVYIDLRSQNITDIRPLTESSTLNNLKHINFHGQTFTGESFEIENANDKVEVDNIITDPLTGDKLAPLESSFYDYNSSTSKVTFNNIKTSGTQYYLFESKNVMMGDTPVYFSGVINHDVNITGKMVDIPDANFKRALAEKLGQDVSLPISQKQLESIISLHISGKNISSLEGIQYCKNLEELAASNNKNLEDLSPLSSLNKLYTVNLESTGISDISPLAKIDRLERLFISSNPKLTDISSLEFHPKLESLNCNSNPQIKDFSVLQDIYNLKQLALSGCDIDNDTIKLFTPMAGLDMLILNDNKISDVSPLARLKLSFIRIENQSISAPAISTSNETAEVDNIVVEGRKKNPVKPKQSSEYDYNPTTNKVTFKNITESGDKSYSFDHELQFPNAKKFSTFSGTVTHKIEKTPSENAFNQGLNIIRWNTSGLVIEGTPSIDGDNTPFDNSKVTLLIKDVDGNYITHESGKVIEVRGMYSNGKYKVITPYNLLDNASSFELKLVGDGISTQDVLSKGSVKSYPKGMHNGKLYTILADEHGTIRLTNADISQSNANLESVTITTDKETSLKQFSISGKVNIESLEARSSSDVSYILEAKTASGDIAFSQVLTKVKSGSGLYDKFKTNISSTKLKELNLTQNKELKLNIKAEFSGSSLDLDLDSSLDPVSLNDDTDKSIYEFKSKDGKALIVKTK